MQKKRESRSERIISFLTTTTSMGFAAIKFAAFIFLAFLIIGLFASIAPQELKEGNVAVIPLNGVITTDGEAGLDLGVSSESIIELLEEANENEEIKAIILEIDSPGGTPVATDEIAQAVKNTNKTTIAVIRETGASGAYWVATAADKIFANRMSVTGSIGVQASRLEFGGLLLDHNVTYRRLVAGKYKDLGTRYRDMTSEEQQLYQQILDKLHTEFINAVAENRKLPVEKVRELATGFVYLGSEAKELGLVDEIGTKEDAVKYIESTLNITAETVEYSETGSLFEELSGFSANGFYNIGKGIGSAFSTETKFSFT